VGVDASFVREELLFLSIDPKTREGDGLVAGDLISAQ
jgi:hypothetical protein